MTPLHRVLDPEPVRSLRAYVDDGGFDALDAARRVDPGTIVSELSASGLRGRGGAGFPTGTKWETVAANAAADGTTPTVVVNAAEGEPGSFKDRALLRTNPYRVLEGALIAAEVLDAKEIVVALKQSFTTERRRLAVAVAELTDAGWLADVDIRIVLGPGDYLFGEETALLEVIDGRQPFPRVTPPYRVGIGDEHGGPVLANNVETLANIPGIVAHGADWFRSVGTARSPGTIVCTVSGDTRRAGVGEFPMGTPLRDIIDEIGGGAHEGRRLVATISGVASGLVPAERFDTPATHEDLEAVGGALGAAGFLVLDDSTDLVAFAHAVAHFLAIESCGQCEPCKSDGLAVASELDSLRRSASDPEVGDRVRERLGTITDGARCSLASQYAAVIASVLDRFPEAVEAHSDPATGIDDPLLVAPITDLDGGVAVLDTAQAHKQPDWSYGQGGGDNERWPAAHLGNTPVAVRLRRDPTGGRRAPQADIDDRDTTETDADERPVPVDIGDQLDLVHHELVEALLRTRSRRASADEREAGADRFAAMLDDHLRVLDTVLLPWVRRVAGDPGAAIAERAERLTGTAEEITATLRTAGTDEPTGLQVLIDALYQLLADEQEVLRPLLEHHLDDEELDEIGRAMHEARHSAP